MDEIKICKTCGESKPVSEFYIHTETKAPLGSCKECVKERSRRYYDRNRERYSERGKLYRQGNLAKVRWQERTRAQSRTPEQKERRAEGVRRAGIAMRDRRIKAYLEAHQKMPTCACGCGEEMTFTEKGEINKYRRGHRARLPQANKVDDPDVFMPHEQVLKIFQDIKRRKNWTWPEFAEAIGISEAAMTNYINGSRLHHRRDFVEKVLLDVYSIRSKPQRVVDRDQMGSML